MKNHRDQPRKTSAEIIQAILDGVGQPTLVIGEPTAPLLELFKESDGFDWLIFGEGPVFSIVSKADFRDQREKEKENP